MKHTSTNLHVNEHSLLLILAIVSLLLLFVDDGSIYTMSLVVQVVLLSTLVFYASQFSTYQVASGSWDENVVIWDLPPPTIPS